MGTFVVNTGQNRYRSVAGTLFVRPPESHWRTTLRTYPAKPRHMSENALPTTHMQEVTRIARSTTLRRLANLIVAIVQLSPLPGGAQARRERQASNPPVSPDAPNRITD